MLLKDSGNGIRRSANYDKSTGVAWLFESDDRRRRIRRRRVVSSISLSSACRYDPFMSNHDRKLAHNGETLYTST